MLLERGRQRNIASLRRNAIAWLRRPRQNTTARFWKKWLRLGEGWLGRWITSVSSQPIVFRQSRLRALLPNETTPVPCAAAKPALAHLRRCALALGTLERSADTDPTLPRRNASPDRNATRKCHRRSFPLAKREPQACCLGSFALPQVQAYWAGRVSGDGGCRLTWRVLCGNVFSPLTCVCRCRLIENVRDAKKTIVIATA
jgi:hypothetical protein